MYKINLFSFLLILEIMPMAFAQTIIPPTSGDLDKVLTPHGSDCATTGAIVPPILTPLNDPKLQVIATPNLNTEIPAPKNNCHQGILNAIQGAKASIRMTMFHLTDQAVVQALVNASQKKKIDVQVILDPSSPNLAQTIQTLRTAGIKVVQSSPCFNMTHEKSFVIDGSAAAIQKHFTPTSIIGAMNMTGENQTPGAAHDLTDVCESTRDFDVITHDPTVASDIGILFQQDYESATANPPLAKGACPSPTLNSPSLVLSPTNSEAKLVALIQSATKTIQCTAENWGDQNIQKALIAAATRGVSVQIIAPECDQNADPSYDFDKPATLPMLLGQKGITLMAMPAPSDNTHPYMHSKMCRINDSVTYVGSVNFSEDSTHDNRELGIIFNSPNKAGSTGRQIDQAFQADFAVSNPVPNPVPANWGNCASSSAKN